ncbi:N-succinyl-L,L-diaminopimelate desuccinylase [hydrothermal vent metagenome]|uniref:Succinyl-diaminopimelate desuccinylase n=1 Tax=hydrothermal vent metagenome TaxID=652676 RepID=A0A1W1EIE0_9ZZZZ
MSIIDLFLKLLSYKSITPDDANSLKFIEEYLSNFTSIWVNEGGVKNLFLYKKFGEGEHLCFAGHVDVVPAGDGWASNPFIPKIENGIIYARGAQDMKSGVASFVQAIKDTKKFNGTLSILLTSDEEGDATYGTQIMLQHLKEIDMLPDYSIVAEPTCEDKMGDSIKIGRRGSINGYLTIKGKQGHAAYPQKAINPIDKVAPILGDIAGHYLDNGDEDFAPSQIVITDIRGGMEVTNVTPNELKIMFNVRNSTKTNQDDILKFFANKFEDIDYELNLTQGSYPFVTNRNSYIVSIISNSIQKYTNIKTKLSTAGGTSDARFMGAYGIDVVEFGVINDTIHAINERTTIKEVESLYDIFCDVIENF